MYNQLVFKAHRMGYLVPDMDRQQPSGKYVGATVLDAVVGCHQQPVVTLDYASLVRLC